MRPIVLVTLLLLLGASAGAEEPPAPPRPKQPPPPGIRWERDFQGAMDRAARLGRPLLFAVNALETERANNQLATQAYRSEAWGEASRGYVAFVCNPNEHAATPGACSRYPGHTCSAHKAALDWFLQRFGESLISPQHVILEPDGDVAYRKEYFTYVVSPVLLESYLSNLAPTVAYARAAIGREQAIAALALTPTETVGQAAKAWLGRQDGLAAAAVVNVLDACFDAARRAVLIDALAATPALQVPVLVLAAEERVLYPADEPGETSQWLRTLFAADRAAGVWGATRALVRLENEAERDGVLRIWAGSADDGARPGIDDLPAAERAAAYEALLLAGDRRADPTRVPETWTAGREAEIRRARARRGVTTRSAVKLKALLDAGVPGPLRRGLSDAPPEEVRRHRAAVREALVDAEAHRVRVAAALALLRAGAAAEDAARIKRVILDALDDPLEGHEARSAAIRILGDDPGQSREVWDAALTARLEGGGK